MENVQKIMKKVTAISFPWDDAVPPVLKSWFETLAKAHNTVPEYIFMGAIATCSALMGPTYVQVRETYEEPVNIYALCVGFPGSGKSQAFRMTTRDALRN